MKNIFLVGLSWLAAGSLGVAGPPRGNLIELHSCEVFAGGCVVSSEATLGGRYLLQVWDIAGGAWQGADLGGLRVAVFETGRENLAADRARADHAVIYLPEHSTAQQRAALVSWLKSRDSQLVSSAIQTRDVPMRLSCESN